jgi:L-alanine-DL-glutamate epimerase-like enolase superfamily enzyme
MNKTLPNPIEHLFLFIDTAQDVSGTWGPVSFPLGITAQHFFKHKIAPVEGHIALPEAPGMSIELDEDAIESRTELELS